MSKITPCLWFDGVAEEAARFYVSMFPDSRIDKIFRSPADNPSTPAGAVLTVDFTLADSGSRGSTAVLTSSSPRRPRSSSIATTRRRSTASGMGLRKAADRRDRAAG